MLMTISITLFAPVVTAGDKSVIESFYSGVASWTWGVCLFALTILCIYSCYSCHWYRVKQLEAEMMSGEPWSDDLFNAMHKLSQVEPVEKQRKSSKTKSDFYVHRISRHLSSGSSSHFYFPSPSPKREIGAVFRRVSLHGVSPVGVPATAEFNLSSLARLGSQRFEPSMAVVSKEVLNSKSRDSNKFAEDIIISRKQSYKKSSLSSSLIPSQVYPSECEGMTV